MRCLDFMDKASQVTRYFSYYAYLSGLSAQCQIPKNRKQCLIQIYYFHKLTKLIATVSIHDIPVPSRLSNYKIIKIISLRNLINPLLVYIFY